MLDASRLLLHGKPGQVLAIAIVAIMATIPLATSSTFYLSMLVFIGIYSMLTVGLSLLFGYAGQISVAHAAFYGLGAYTSAILTMRYGIATPIAMAGAAIAPMVIAYAIGRPVMRLTHFYLAMGTLALGDMFSVLFVQQRSLTGGFTGLAGVPPPSLFGFTVNTQTEFYYLVWIIAGAIVLFSHNVISSRVGRALRAIQGSETAAAAMGIDVVSYKVWMFTLGAGYAGLAGSLYGQYVSFISPEAFTSQLSILLIVMLYIGGLRSLWGSLLGAAFAVILPEVLSRYRGVDVLAYGVVLLIVMILLPNGLAGVLSWLRSRILPSCGRRAAEKQPGEVS